MKKLLTSPVLMLVLAVVLLSTMGCGDDDDGVTQSNPNDLLGTWIQSSVTVNGVAGDLAVVLEWDTGTVEGTIAFFAGDTYEAINLDASDSVLYLETGTYVIDDTWLILTATAENDISVTPHQVYNGQWSVSGTVLTLTQTVGQDTMVLTCNRPS